MHVCMHACMHVCMYVFRSLLKAHTKYIKGVRVLRLFPAGGELTLPLRREHDYLGVKIGYHRFERSNYQTQNLTSLGCLS